MALIRDREVLSGNKSLYRICAKKYLHKNEKNNNNASRYAELRIYSRGQNSFRFPWNWFLIYFSLVNGANSRMNFLSLNGT